MAFKTDTKYLVGAAVCLLVSISVGGYLWYRILKAAFA